MHARAFIIQVLGLSNQQLASLLQPCAPKFAAGLTREESPVE